MRWIWSWSGLAGSRCQGEASRLLRAGNVDVEPLAWLELRPSVTVENSRGFADDTLNVSCSRRANLNVFIRLFTGVTDSMVTG
jgi:hypothetical protein